MNDQFPQIDTRPKRTPTPSATTPPPASAPPWLVSVIGVALTFGAMGLWMRVGPGFVASGLINDLAEQYQLLADGGASQLELGMRASAVAEACLQAKRREAYKQWKATSDRHLRAAGMPVPR